MLRQSTSQLAIDTLGRGLFEITKPVAAWVAELGAQGGLVTLFARLVPDGDPVFRHRDEGFDDMPAHVRSALTAVQLSVPIAEGRLALGIWQGIYVWEHRLKPLRREIALHFIGE